MSIIYNNTNIDNINYNNIELDKVIYNNIVVYEKGISIDDIKLNDTIDVELSGSNTGTYTFKLVYKSDDNKTSYWLYQTNLADDNEVIWTIAHNENWTAVLLGTIINNVKIPTKAQLDKVEEANRAIPNFGVSFYWTDSTYKQSDEQYYQAYIITANNGEYYNERDPNCGWIVKDYTCGVVPLIVLTL